MRLIILLIIYFSFSSMYSQNYYGLTLLKSYTKEEIKNHFWDGDFSTSGVSDIKIVRNGEDIRLEFGSNDKKSNYIPNTLCRILVFNLDQKKALSMYEDSKLYFGKPNGGFEEECLVIDKLYNFPSVKKKNYVFYYFDKYIKGDMLKIHFEITSMGYCGGKLCENANIDINYHDKYWEIPVSNSSKKSDLFKGWQITKQY